MFAISIANTFTNGQPNGTEQYRKSQCDMDELNRHFQFEQLGFQAVPYKDVPTINFFA